MATEPASMLGAPASVRIVSWNCNMALARKAPRLLALRPDIAIVQECAAKAELPGMVRIGWTGRFPYKGLAVFARPELGAMVAEDAWDPTREWFLPVRVDSLGLDLLASWAMNQRGLEDRPKKGRAGATMEHYRSFLSSGRALVLGDLNDNVIWDTERSPVFAGLTQQLATMHLVNLYYARTGETPGAESRASLFFLRHADKPYLIDHVFLPEAWLGRIGDFEVGSAADWLDVSDHAPLILDLAVSVGGSGVASANGATSRGPAGSALPSHEVGTSTARVVSDSLVGCVADASALPAPLTMRIATWNMNHWQQPVRPTDTRAAGWEHLSTIADVALLQETVPPASVPRDRLVYRDLAGMRPWGSAVVAFRDGIGVEEIWSVGGTGRRRYRLANTHPGSVAVARLRLDGIAPITAVSLYNVLDGHPAANLLRVIADLVPLLESVDGERVVLGGDFNVYRAVPGRSTKAETVFALLHDLGLHSVGELAIPRPEASPDCACGTAGGCRHVPTWHGFELDHLFVTKALWDQVRALEVDRSAVEQGLSDHAVLVAQLELSSAPVARAWDAETFVAEVRARHGAAAADVVAKIGDWAGRKDDILRATNVRDREVSDILIPRAIYPTMFMRVTFRESGFNPQWLTGIHAAKGTLDVSFQYMSHPPFDTVAGREPLREMLNAIPGVGIRSDRLVGRPSIPLATLIDSAALERFLAVLDRAVDETVPTRSAAVAVDAETCAEEPGDSGQES